MIAGTASAENAQVPFPFPLPYHGFRKYQPEKQSKLPPEATVLPASRGQHIPGADRDIPDAVCRSIHLHHAGAEIRKKQFFFLFRY